MSKLVKTLRSLKTHARYEQHCSLSDGKECYLCNAPAVKRFTYWKIIENQYPYDEIAAISHMAVSLRHTKETELSDDEFKEYEKVKKYIHQTYDTIMENTNKQKSIPNHYHVHLLILKEQEIQERPRAVFLTPEKVEKKMAEP